MLFCCLARRPKRSLWPSQTFRLRLRAKRIETESGLCNLIVELDIVRMNWSAVESDFPIIREYGKQNYKNVYV